MRPLRRQPDDRAPGAAGAVRRRPRRPPARAGGRSSPRGRCTAGPGVFLSFTEEMAPARHEADVAARCRPASTRRARRSSPTSRLADGAEVVRVERVRLADGVPIAFEDAAVRGRARAPCSTPTSSVGSLHDELGRLGVVATSATGTVTARLRDAAPSAAARGRRRARRCSSSCACCSTSTAARSSAPSRATSPTATSSTSSTRTTA